jgi:hypothetical protein
MPASTTAETIGIVKDIVLTVAALIGMIVAVFGLNTWNRQLKGGAEYELTRRLLKCTYRLREAIKGVRNPTILPSEQVITDGEKHERIERQKYLGLAFAYQARWEKVVAARDELQTELLEGEVLWGDQIYEKFDLLFKLQNELLADVNSYLALANPDINEDAKDAWYGIRRNRREVLYEMMSPFPDPYSDDISNVVAEIESYLKPHLAK